MQNYYALGNKQLFVETKRNSLVSNYEPSIFALPTARGRAAVARRAHNPKVIGSIPVLATQSLLIHFRRDFCLSK